MANDSVKPNFFIVGAPRAGTTSMNGYLRRHPEVFIPYVKEAHFFGADLVKTPHPFFVLDKDRYLRLFAAGGKSRAVGETSVMYLYSRTAAEEIKEFSPEARIVIMLRHPVDMMYSHHSHLYWAGYEDVADFRRALALEPRRRQGHLVPAGANLRQALFYRKTARYSEQISRYLRCFGRDKVHVILYDDLREDTAGVYAEVVSFLGLSPGFQPEFRVANACKKPRCPKIMPYIQNPPAWIKRPLGQMLPHNVFLWLLLKAAACNTCEFVRPRMPSDLRKELVEEFSPEIERTARLIGRDLSHWLE